MLWVVTCLFTLQLGDMWAAVLKSTLFTVPVTVAVLDVFGYVARVEGASMQVSSLSTETICHILFELLMGSTNHRIGPHQS